MITAIENRRSVRTYLKEQLTNEEVEAIQKILDKNSLKKGIFGHQARFFFLNHLSSLDDEAKRIGTYGFVKNAPAFIGGIIQNNFYAIIDFGYLFERIILEATKLEFGTVWLGGTFDRKAFSSKVNEGEVIPAISPIGHPEDRMSFKEKTIRTFIKANQRKHFAELFFDQSIGSPISEKNKGNYKLSKYLEFVQVGPSASNKQPWRVIINQNSAHFYLKKTENYGSGLPFDIQALDMGIAICHFEEGLISDKRIYQIKKDPLVPKVDGLIYVTSFIIEA